MIGAWEIVFSILMFIVGAAVGSFLCCQAWRLRYKELGKKRLGKRSVCLKCGARLKWYDNVPVFSWIVLRGKCRKCGAKIGVAEILSELSMGAVFVWWGSVVSGWGYMEAGMMLMIILIAGFLAIYDGMFGELPNFVLWIGVVLAGSVAILRLVQSNFAGEEILNLVGAMMIFGGVYLVLYLISKGRWVGDGDYILGMILGAALGNSWLALVALCLANFLGCGIMLPQLKGKNKRKQKIYFGPFMVAGFMLSLMFADLLLSMIK